MKLSTRHILIIGLSLVFFAFHEKIGVAFYFLFGAPQTMEEMPKASIVEGFAPILLWIILVIGIIYFTKDDERK